MNRRNQRYSLMGDKRYSIGREYCGYAEPRYVVRFCGTYLGNGATRSDGVRIARKHRDKFRAMLDEIRTAV